MIDHFILHSAFFLLFLSLVPCGIVCFQRSNSAVDGFWAWGASFAILAASLILLCFQNNASLNYAWLSLGHFNLALSFQFRLYNSFLMLFMWGTYFCATGFLLLFRNLDYKLWSVFLFLACFVGAIITVHAISIPALVLGFVLQSLGYYFLGTLKHEQGTWTRFGFSGLLIDFLFIFILIGLSASHDVYAKLGPIFFVCLISKHAFAIGLNFDRLFKGEGRFAHLGLHFSTFKLFVLILWVKNIFPSIGSDFAVWFFVLGTFTFLSGALYTLSVDENSDSESLIRMYAGLCLFSVGLGHWALLPEFLLLATTLSIFHYQLGCFVSPLDGKAPPQVVSFLYSFSRWLSFVTAFLFVMHLMHRSSSVLGMIIAFLMGLFLIMQGNLKIRFSMADILVFFSGKPIKKIVFIILVGTWACLLLVWFAYKINWVQIPYFLRNNPWAWAALVVILGPMIGYLISERRGNLIGWLRKQIGEDFIEKAEGSFYAVYDMVFITPFRMVSTFLSQTVDQFIFEDKLFSSLRSLVKTINPQPLKFGAHNTSWYMLWVFVLLVLLSLMFQIQ